MAASAERCSTRIWRGLGGIAFRSVPRRAAGAPGPRAAGYTRRDARARGVVDRGGGAGPGARRAGPRPAGADARRPAVAERHGPVDAVEHRRRRWTEDVAGGPDLRRRHHPHRRHHDRDPHGRTRALAAHRPRRSADRVGPLARPPPPPAAQQAAGAGQGEEGEGAAAEESLRRRAQALPAHRRRRVAAPREGRLAQAAPSSRGTFGLHDSPNVPLGRQDLDASPSGARHVHVPRPERAALRGEARTVETDERERLAALARRRRVATPDVREAAEVQRGDERVADAADGGAAGAVDRVAHRDAVVAADRLRDHAVVGHSIRRAQVRAALARTDRAGDLAGARAGAGVARDGRLDAAHERGPGREQLRASRVARREQVARRAAMGRLQPPQAHALRRDRPLVRDPLAGVALGLRVQDERDDRREHDQPGGAAAPQHVAPALPGQPRRADEDGAPAVRAPLARGLLDEAAVGARPLHLTSVDIVSGYGQAVPVDRYDAGRQPAGRASAPGRLAFVQAFLNSFWDLDAGGADRWSDPAAYARWLRERGFRPGDATAADLARAIELRDALHALALANHDDARAAPQAEATLDRIANDVAPHAGLTPRSPRPHPPRAVPGDGPAPPPPLVLGSASAPRLDGTWPRLKACPHAHCGWAFYDRSRNRSSQWCSMRICGNRTKGARHRERTAARR